MSSKVLLPRSVVEALDYAREKLNWSHANILVRTCRKDWESCEMDAVKEFCRTDNERFVIASALVNGYEVEKTPEDKVREYYIKERNLQSDMQDGSDITIQTVLDILNIKISGVNAE